MKVHALIACRMGSCRLPGKAALPILGKPMIERMIERVQQSRCLHDIAVATTHLPEDQELVDIALRIGVGVFRGSPDDVLGRLYAAAETLDADLLVELLGDNPLVHSELIDDVIGFHLKHSYDYSASVTAEYPHAGADAHKFPVGIRVQVFSPAVLEKCAREAGDQYYRENSTTYIYEHPEIFRLGYLEAKGKWNQLNRPELTFAVNYRKNFDLVTKIFERCYPRDSNFSLFDVIDTFDADPALHPLMGN